MYMNVPNVDFSSLNLASPMAKSSTTVTITVTTRSIDEEYTLYIYAGPSLTVQRIANTVAGQGSILPVSAPSVNSTWDLDFNGPSLRCNPVSSGFRNAVLANILNYTVEIGQQDYIGSNCTYGPGYMAWHPTNMDPNKTMTEYLPFNLNKLNSSGGALNNVDDGDGFGNNGMASVFLAIAPTLFSSSSSKDDSGPTMCRGKPWYQAGLAQFYNTSTVLRCDVHNSTYHTTFSFVNGVQKVDIKNVTDVTDTPMITIGSALVYFNPSNQTYPDLNEMNLRPQACPPSNEQPATCLFDRRVLSTLSYQAVMHAFTDLVAGMISPGGAQDRDTLITSTRLSSTILAGAPELNFLQSNLLTVQQRAVMWKQQPYSGLANAAAGIKATLPFQQALEQLFQNITISLMSAPDLQYVHLFLPRNDLEVPC